MTNKDRVRVYLEFINGWGEVTERTLIAEFRNIDWARRFVEETKASFEGASFEGDALVRVAVEH